MSVFFSNADNIVFEHVDAKPGSCIIKIAVHGDQTEASAECDVNNKLGVIASDFVFKIELNAFGIF